MSELLTPELLTGALLVILLFLTDFGHKYITPNQKEEEKNLNFFATLPELLNAQSFSDVGQAAKAAFPNIYSDQPDYELGLEIMDRYGERLPVCLKSPVPELLSS